MSVVFDIIKKRIKKRFTEAQIAFALRQAESGTTVAEIIAQGYHNILFY